ncbi:hypothetical protein K9N68_05990 [Kovacikia minuta CCNUW1]|uniref:hypothetical protein n=1 Tax=Kovacikia minuta TaxID=2931930 RepID=UPI001CCEE0CD|nr:hypothetical protein [Kovacikia minuta]UBF27491.1 hypothetical protein K9N68_05990 [Kovacikia minuta CCNUW1]
MFPTYPLQNTFGAGAKAADDRAEKPRGGRRGTEYIPNHASVELKAIPILEVDAKDILTHAFVPYL